MKETTLTYTGAEVQALLDKINNLPSASNDSNQKVIVGRCVPEHAEPGKRYFSRKLAIKIDARDLGTTPSGKPLILRVYIVPNSRVSVVFTVPAQEEWAEFISRLREEAKTYYIDNSIATIGAADLPSSAYFNEKLALWHKVVDHFSSETTSTRVKVYNSRLVINTNLSLPIGVFKNAATTDYIRDIKVAMWKHGKIKIKGTGDYKQRSKGFRLVHKVYSLGTFLGSSNRKKRLYCPVVWWRGRVRKTNHLIWILTNNTSAFGKGRVIK